MFSPELRERLVAADRRVSAENSQLVETMVGDRIGLRVAPRDLADIGRAAIIGLLLYAAIDDEQRDHYESLVQTLFVLMTRAAVEDTGKSRPARRRR